MPPSYMDMAVTSINPLPVSNLLLVPENTENAIKNIVKVTQSSTNEKEELVSI